MHTEIEITEDQLAIDWTLTETDLQFIKNNSNQNIKLATQMCYLRAYGRFVSKDDVIIQKLANRTDNVSKAIRAFGRIIKSIYILRYIADQELRHTVHLHLNHGESRHQLAKKLFFLNRGAFKTSDYE